MSYFLKLICTSVLLTTSSIFFLWDPSATNYSNRWSKPVCSVWASIWSTVIQKYLSVVRFKSFWLSWLFSDCPGCYVGGQYSEMHCDSCCGYIASPNYPYPYDNFLTVSWILHVPDNHYVRLDIIEHNVESPLPDCSRDHILVYDLDYHGARKNVIGRYCNAAAPLGPLYSNWNFMEVRAQQTRGIELIFF